MNPRFRVTWRALAIAGAAVVIGGSPARAQFSYPVFGTVSDPLTRSPRLVGMGRLELVIPDLHNRITLWDYAGNPVGLATDDSASTLDLRPATASASSVHDFSDLTGEGERQDFAARGSKIGYEGWRRIPGLSVFGAIGDVSLSRTDQPYALDRELRSSTAQPNGMVLLGGRVPYFWSTRFHYALRLFSAYSTLSDEYRFFTKNQAGQYIDRNGLLGPPPNLFDPDEVDVDTFGGGLSAAYSFGRDLTMAVAADGLRHKFSGTNDGDRYVSQREETRPMGLYQASLIGRLGKHFEWGADGRTWTSHSSETWLFSISTNTGGAGAAPFDGRGDYETREEKGSTLRTRARWVSGPLELGADFGTAYRKITETPPPITDLESFNYFLNQIFYRTRADTTVMPDSVVYSQTEERSWNVGGGASLRFGKHGGLLGVEYHQYRIQRDLSQSGFKPKVLPTDPDPANWTYDENGPRQTGWDVRTGLEYGLMPVLAGRVGFIHRFDNYDELTAQNEQVANSGTAGFTLTPRGARWKFDASYELQWFRADYGDPSLPRGSRQLITADIGWVF